MVDGLFLAGFALVGFLPAVTVLFGRRKLSLFVCLGWLLVAAAALLRPAPNDPHPWGQVMFLLFFLPGWIAAFAVVATSRRVFRRPSK